MTGPPEQKPDLCTVVTESFDISRVAQRLGNRASNQKVAGSIPGCVLCPLHPTCLGGMSLYLL